MDALPRRALSLFDAVCLIVGIIVGAGVYQVAPDVARGAGSAAGVLALWAAGALLSLCGALGYAELASAFRDREGGDVVYLGRAYGPWAGFLFGWTQLAVVRPGDIAVMAFAFATYARALLEPLAAGGSPGPGLLPYAAGAVAVLTALNVAGVTEAKWAQNLLTVAKVIGLVAIAGLALATPRAGPAAADVEPLPWTVALILVLFSYGGWNEMAYVAAEVKHPRRSIVRALLLGMAAVAALYLLLNGAFLHALGVGGVAASSAVASDAVSIRLPGTGSRLVAALIAVSALGAVNGLIFTGARISYAAGTEHRAFRALGRWNPRTGTPAIALVVQGAIAIALIVLLGSFVEALLYTAPAVYAFYLATTAAVAVLRRREPGLERPYRVTLYPLPLVVFGAVCVFLLQAAATFRPGVTAASGALVALGLPIYWLTNRHPPGRD